MIVNGMIATINGAILICVYTLIGSTVTLSEYIRCEWERFEVIGIYNGSIEHIIIDLRLSHTLTLFRVHKNGLLSMYPWLQINEMDPEVRFAKEQVKFMKELISKFPNSNPIEFEYSYSHDLVTILIINSSYAKWVDGNKFAIEDIDEVSVSPYAKGRNVSMIKSQNNAILQRWRTLCKTIQKNSEHKDVNVSFFYYYDLNVFSCSAISYSPMEFRLTLYCGEYGRMRQHAIRKDGIVYIGKSTDDMASCAKDLVKCEVEPVYDDRWTVEGFENRSSIPKIVSTESPAKRISTVDTNVIIVPIVIVVITALVLFIILRYKLRFTIADIIEQARSRIRYVSVLRW